MNTTDDAGYAPVHVASLRGHFEVVEVIAIDNVSCLNFLCRCFWTMERQSRQRMTMVTQHTTSFVVALQWTVHVPMKPEVNFKSCSRTDQLSTSTQCIFALFPHLCLHAEGNGTFPNLTILGFHHILLAQD